MTKSQVALTFLELTTQLQHEGLLNETTGPVMAALRGEHGEIHLAELSGGDLTVQELSTKVDAEPFLYAFVVKPDVKTLLLLRGTYAMQIAESQKQLTAELDDMSQIVGLTARVAKDLSQGEIARCLRGRNSCFVKGSGMLITGRSVSEAVTGAILLEKAAMTHLLAKKIGGAKRVPLFSALLMHMIYQKKYSKISLSAETEQANSTPSDAKEAPAQTAREREIRAQIVAYGIRMVDEGLLQGTWGNLAVRLDATHMLCTPSGMSYRTLTPDDIVKVELSTLDYGDQRKPTSEKRMHRDIFENRADVGAVIHTHAKLSGVFAAARKNICCVEGERERILGGEVRCAGHALPSTKKLSNIALRALGNHYGCLLMNHGVICCGADLESAYLACKAAEEQAQELLGL